MGAAFSTGRWFYEPEASCETIVATGVTYLRIKRLRDLEIEFLICEILSTSCE